MTEFTGSYEFSPEENDEKTWQCQNAMTIAALGGNARCIVGGDTGDYSETGPCDACWSTDHAGDFWDAQQENTVEYQEFIKGILNDS